MRSRLFLSLSIFLIIAVGYFAYARRFRLAAKIWHWKHGFSTTMGNYEVPVPEHWLITDQSSVAFTMINTAPALRKDGNFQTPAVINIFPFRNRLVVSGGLDSWLSLKRKRLESEGVKSIEEKNFSIGGAEASCIGGSEMRDVILSGMKKVPGTDIISLECRSADDLSVLFVGEPSDLQPFYSFAAQIRRIQ